MVEVSRPWTGTSVGDSGPYSSEQWADIWKTIGIGGAQVDAGPLIGSGTSPDIGLTVQANSPAAANVVVTPGSALVEGTWYQNTANNTLTIAANGSGNPRIDTIVLRKDYSAQTVRLAVKQGTPAVTPSPPGLTQTDGTLWEIPLADVAVANGFVSIAAADITPRRHFANAADGVYVLDVLNNSGATLETGQVVIWDTSADRAVTTTTTVSHGKVAGVWIGRTANGAYGRVLVKGIGYVKTTGAIASRYVGLFTSGTAGSATDTPSSTTTNVRAKPFAWSLVTTSGAGLCLAYINATGEVFPVYDVDSDYAGTNTITSAVQTSFADTTITITLTLAADSTGSIEFYASGTARTTGGTADVFFDMILDSATRYSGAGATGNGMQFGTPFSINGIFNGLSAGSHTLTLQWRINVASGTPTVTMDVVQMHAKEIR